MHDDETVSEGTHRYLSAEFFRAHPEAGRKRLPEDWWTTERRAMVERMNRPLLVMQARNRQHLDDGLAAFEHGWNQETWRKRIFPALVVVACAVGAMLVLLIVRYLL